MAMSVRGVTSPSILKAVRASRTATLKDVHPRYASFTMRLARLSPTRCQNSTTPSAPAFSIMSSIREARATSIMSDLRRSSSHEGAEHLLQARPPLLLGFRGDRIPLEVPQLLDDNRQESVQCAGVMYGAVVPTSLYAMVTISWRGPGPTRGPSFDWRYCAISLFFLNSFVSPNFSTNRMRVSRFSSPATASS